ALGGVDVGLIEGVEPEQRPRDRRRQLPAEHLGAELAQTDRREASQRSRRRSAATVERTLAPPHRPLHQRAPGAVRPRFESRLARDRQDALALLPGRLGEELLEPGTEQL